MAQQPISKATPVTIGFMSAVIALLGWIVVLMFNFRSEIARDMEAKYVTRELFHSEVDAIRAQIADLKDTVRRYAK